MDKIDRLYQHLKDMPPRKEENPALQNKLKQELSARIKKAEAKKKQPAWIRPFAFGTAIAGAAAIAAVIVFFIIPVFSPAQRLFSRNSLAVTMATGSITIEQGSEKIQAAAADTVSVGEAMHTGPSTTALMQFSEEILLQAEPDTWFSVKTAENTGDANNLTLVMDTGMVTMNVDSSEKQATVAIIVPFMTIDVTGTVFSVARDNHSGMISVSVYKGAVKVTPAPALGSAALSVPSGFTLLLSDSPKAPGMKYFNLSKSMLAHFRKFDTHTPIVMKDETAQPIRINIATEPDDATIILDNTQKSLGSLSFLTEPDTEHSLEILREGYTTLSKTILADKNTDLSFSLTPVDKNRENPDLPAGQIKEHEFPESTVHSVLVPQKQISVDGDRTDWADIAPLLVDPVGDIVDETPCTDISRIYLAYSGSTLFTGLVLPGCSVLNKAVTYEILLKNSGTSYLFSLNFSDNQSWNVSCHISGSQGTQKTISSDIVKSAPGFVEFDVSDKSLLRLFADTTPITMTAATKTTKFGSLETTVDKTEPVTISFNGGN